MQELDSTTTIFFVRQKNVKLEFKFLWDSNLTYFFFLIYTVSLLLLANQQTFYLY